MMIIWLMLLISEKTFGATTTRPAEVCLTWKIKSDDLELRCKTENFRYSITFYDPVGNERAFCTPNSCIPLMNRTYLSQNITTQETYLTIPLGADAEKFNGWWVCTYGNTNGKAKVEITLSTNFTIVRKEDNTTRKKSTPPYNSDYSCVKLICLSSFAWLTVGFLATHLLMSITTAAKRLDKCREYLRRQRNSLLQTRLCICLCRRERDPCPVPVIKNGTAIIIIFVLIVVFISTRNEKCNEHLSFEPLMILLAIVVGFLLRSIFLCLLQINYGFLSIPRG